LVRDATAGLPPALSVTRSSLFPLCNSPVLGQARCDITALESINGTTMLWPLWSSSSYIFCRQAELLMTRGDHEL